MVEDHEFKGNRWFLSGGLGWDFELNTQSPILNLGLGFSTLAKPWAQNPENGEQSLGFRVQVQQQDKASGSGNHA